MGICGSALAAPASAAPGKLFGVHEVKYGDGVASRLSQLGAQSQRLDLAWQFVEPQAPLNGVHKYQFSATDAAYAAALGRGIRPLFVLMSAPKWAWGNGVPKGDQPFGMPPGADYLDDWAAFVAAAARRYPLALGFEVWNEPDAWPFWGRGIVPLDPAAYTRVLARAYAAVKSASPCTPVVGGALAAYPSTVPGVHLSVTDFVGGMMRAGAANYLDAFSVHDYALGPTPPDAADWTIPPNWVRWALASNGIGLPIWITESGVSTTGNGAVSEQGQAQSLADLYRWYRAQNDIEALFVHTLLEHGTIFDRETGYALIRGGAFSAAKPAFNSLRNAVSLSPPRAPGPGLAFHVSIPVDQNVVSSGSLKVAANCVAPGTLGALGGLTVHLSGGGTRTYVLHSGTATLNGGGSTTLSLRVQDWGALLAQRSQIEGPLEARVMVVASDAAGAMQSRLIRMLLPLH